MAAWGAVWPSCLVWHGAIQLLLLGMIMIMPTQRNFSILKKKSVKQKWGPANLGASCRGSPKPARLVALGREPYWMVAGRGGCNNPGPAWRLAAWLAALLSSAPGRGGLACWLGQPPSRCGHCMSEIENMSCQVLEIYLIDDCIGDSM